MEGSTSPARTFDTLAHWVARIRERLDSLPPERQALLGRIAEVIAERLRNDQSVHLAFLCTHNSRRSQFAQVAAALAAHLHGIENLTSSSAGTEVTACHRNVVESLERAGFHVTAEARDDDQTTYEVRFADRAPTLHLYSKPVEVLADSPDPIVALFCCDDAHEACPTTPWASERFSMSYTDPKIADGSGNEATVYDECRDRIAAEMLFLMRAVAAMHRAGP